MVASDRPTPSGTTLPDRPATATTRTETDQHHRAADAPVTDPSNPYALSRTPAPASSSRTAIDLFSGVGGLTLGLQNAGFRVRLAVDLDSACEATHRRNFPELPFLRADIQGISAHDVRLAASLNDGELDLLAGGPPCQGFSIIGQRELLDPRNSLLHHFIRVAEELRPKILLIENVPGLATLARGAALRAIGDAFDAAGYSVDVAELLAAQYGVPQMRWRMFFIGWRRDLASSGGFPAPTHGTWGIGDLVPNRTVTPQAAEGFLTIRDAIGDLPPLDAGSTARQYHSAPDGPYQQAMRLHAFDELHNHYAARLAPQNIDRIRRLAPGDDWRSLPVELLPPGMRRALRKDHTRRFRRMQWTGVARSIITRFRDPKSGEYIHPEQDRTISIREAARIQSFPDWFIFEGTNSQQYDQVGNAVPPLLAKAIGLELHDMLTAGRPEWRPAVKCRYPIPPSMPLALAAD